MNAMQKMISLRSFFLSVLALVVGAGLALVIGPGTASAAEETFTQSATITVPGGLNSFDISFVDPKLGLYFLADRTNSTVDQVVTKTNVLSQLAKGSFVGLQPGDNTSGPNGVITANNHTEVWAADGVVCTPTNPPGGCGPITQTSRIQVIDINTGTVTHSIDTGGQRRSDELCEDPQHHVVMVANDDASDLFLTFISTQTYEIVKRGKGKGASDGKIFLNGTDPNGKKINATDGIEQCQWSPRTKKFYLAVPEVNGDGTNSEPGVVLEINPTAMKVERVFHIDFGFLPASGATPATADCLGPQGLAIGPLRQILLGCAKQGKGAVIIHELDGSEIQKLSGLNGNDEVWYNPGDNHYFLAGSNHKGSSPIAGPILGIVDQTADTGDPDAAVPTLASSHSVAADPVNNQVYVPVKAAGTLCGALNGCIAVFQAEGDDAGICGGKVHLTNGDPVFVKTVCP